MAADDLDESRLDRTIPGYILCEEIGRGGMGIVYRARDARFERDVAIKLLGEKVSADSFSAVRFRNEARITAQLQHPGIPPVHDLGTLPDGKPFLAMKLVKGSTLKTLLDRRESPAADRGRFVAIFEQICNAVGYAHAHKVIHRDLKPSNVMVGKFGEIQIMDWGLAKVVGEHAFEETQASNDGSTLDYVTSAIETPQGGDSATRTGSVLGTPAYMPPEQASGEIRRLDARSDVFALGAILCEMLTRLPPYVGTSPNDVRIKAVRGELQETFSRLDACKAEPALVALAKKCLAFKQEDRPADGQAVADKIGQIRADAESRAREAELARSAALVREAGEKKRRRQFSIAAGAIGAALVLGIVGTSYGLWRERHAAIAEGKAKEEAAKKQKEAEQAAISESKAKEDAKEKQKVAEVERTRAERREQQAIEAVKRFGDAVAKNPDLKNSVQLESLRKELLKEPLAFFKSLRESLEKENDTRPESLDRLASAAMDIGVLTHDIGDKKDALQAFEEAELIFERLAEQNSTVTRVQEQLAHVRLNIGVLYDAMGKPAEALSALEKGKRICERIAAEQPTAARFQLLLAQFNNNRGLVLSSNGKLADALAAHNESMQCYDRLLQGAPSAEEYQRGLAMNRANSGMILRELGRSAEAIEAQKCAAEIMERLIKSHPLKQYYYDLAGYEDNIGILLLDAGKLVEAAAAFKQASDVSERLVRADPTNVDYLSKLADNQSNLALALSVAGRTTDAQAASERAIQAYAMLVEGNPSDVELQVKLAKAEINFGILLGNVQQPGKAMEAYEKARSILERLAKGNPATPAYQQSLGAVLNNMAMLELNVGKFPQAKELLLAAIEHQKRALEINPRDPTRRQFLTNHYTNLLRAARELKDANLQKEADEGLAKLKATDPRFLALDERIAALEKGEPAKDAQELFALSQRAYETGKFTLAARFFNESLERAPELAKNRQTQHLYGAACRALVAAAKEGSPLDDATRSTFRAAALGWLKRELGLWEELYAQSESRPLIAKTLERWQKDIDLASIRAPEMLAALPEAERKEWETLWARVKELLEKAK